MDDRLATIDIPKTGLLRLFRGAGSPYNTSPVGRDLPPYQVALVYLHPFSRLAATDMGRKFGAIPLWGTWVPIWHYVAWSEVYLPTKYVASWSMQPFGHNTHGPKIRGCPFGALGHYITQSGKGRRLPPYQVDSGILIQPFGNSRQEPKIGVCAP